MTGGREVEATETGEEPGWERISEKTLRVCVFQCSRAICSGDWAAERSSLVLSVLYSSFVAGK